MASQIPGLELIDLAPDGDALVRDYHDGAESLAAFYAGSPWDPSAYARKAEEVDARFDAADRAEVARMLRPAGDAARQRLDGWAEGRGLLVTTGQQPGLFGGPLYTIYKALSAVRLAEALERELDRPTLAVFWVASEDHDLAEVDHTWLLDRGNELRRVDLGVRHDGHDGRRARGASMANRPLGATVEDALETMRDVLPDSDFSGPLFDDLRAAYRPEASVADAFTELLARLLADQPIALIQASDPALKRRSLAVLRRELEHGAEHEARLRARAEELEAAGYGVQVPILPDAENVFREAGGARERLVREGGGWVTRQGGEHLERDALLRELEASPERFSPNVLLRPVVESAALPTLAYVGGPAELRYFAELGCLFDAHGIGMPLFLPRASFAVVESKVRKVLDKLHLEMETLRRPVHELAGRIAAEELPEEVEAALSQLRRDIGQSYGALQKAAQTIDPTLKGPISSARSASFAELDGAEKKIMRQLKEQNAVVIGQLEKARVNLFPNDAPQERVLGPHQYLIRYGPAFLDMVAERCEVRLDRPAPEWTGVDCGGAA